MVVILVPVGLHTEDKQTDNNHSGLHTKHCQSVWKCVEERERMKTECGFLLLEGFY